MKVLERQISIYLFIIALISYTLPLQAQEDDSMNADFVTVSGVVKDKQTKKVLPYVNISIPRTNVGTVTNEDGEFTIKVLKTLSASQIEVSHIGYLNEIIPVGNKDVTNYTVMLEPNVNSLQEVVVHARDPRYIVEEAMRKVDVNFSNQGNLLTGFYRETAQKGRRFINISEAIVYVYKTSYRDASVARDRVQLYKGRKLLSQKSGDTLVVKLLGGPTLSVYVDLAKNPELLFDENTLHNYSFRMEESVMLNKRLNYVISFVPQVILPYALYYGKLYIDKETLSFTRAEINLSMDDKNKATEAILKKKPFGLRFQPQEVSFIITYQQRNGLTYLSYVRNDVRFKCDWKRKLFATNYTIRSEMVITDAKVQKEEISYKNSFKNSQSLSDKVADFTDENFWGAYNIIAPTETLENAVNKLKKNQK